MGDVFVDFDLLRKAADKRRQLRAGDVIFKEGEPGDEFFVVDSGKVAIRLGNRTLDILAEGQVFGEMALIDSGPRSASAIAETDCVVIPVSEKQFLFMVSEAPYFALSVMRVLVERQRRSNWAMPGD